MQKFSSSMSISFKEEYSRMFHINELLLIVLRLLLKEIN
jgi:hypothetical protein